jgi:cytochrome c-type biogenesis protein CcmH/NrfG
VRLLTLPFQGILWIFEEVASRAEEQLYDVDALRRELIERHRDLEAGLLDPDEFARREAELARQLARAEEWHRRRRGH